MSPMELDKRDFKKAVRGYSEEEVDYFLAQVRADYEALYKENQDAIAKLEDYEQNMGKYKALEHTLNNTLIVAQQTAEDLKRNAEKAAELILEEAKLKAQQRVHEAEAEVRKLALQKEELLKRIQELKVRLRAFLRAQLDLLEENADLEGKPNITEPVIVQPEIKATPEPVAQESVSEAPKDNTTVSYSWSRDEDTKKTEQELAVSSSDEDKETVKE